MELSTMDSEYAQLEEQYHAVTSALGRKISALQTVARTALTPDVVQQKEALVEECENDIYEANQVIQKMEVEVRHYPYHLASKVRQQIKQFRSGLETQKRDFNRIRLLQPSSSAVQAQRRNDASHRSQRRALLQANQSVMRQDQSLANTTRLLDEATETGIGVTTSLHEQREQLLRSKDAVAETNTVLVRARRTLQRMARRAVMNKVLTGFVIFVELLAIVLIVYLKWIRKPHHDNNGGHN
eukprot:TRINITY_DN65180_c0_g1_i4.p1 TRINITY_DN65180_c0_g1~~TRINITY_DN65180_c0_g1_i4.p1  ORF type:complete len:241 (+),score=110.41 TRINITY_DN65180_c0_g1_i4:122-844(+)